MPYKVKGNCVYKKDTGAKVGCTKGSVQKYLGALYANANESIEQNKLKGGKADKIRSLSALYDYWVKKGYDNGGVSKSLKKELEHEIALGKKIESEHTKDPEKILEIVFDHLVEEKDYYTKSKPKNWAEKEIKKELNESSKKLVKKLLHEALFDKFRKKPIFKLTPNVWTHKTDSKELINHIKNGGEFIGKKEDLNKFNVPIKGSFATFTNQHAPNFKKGSIFSGFESNKYLITTDLSDDAFQPNWNARNYDNLEDSQNVAVLKPGFRNSQNFKLWEKNKNGEYEQLK